MSLHIMKDKIVCGGDNTVKLSALYIQSNQIKLLELYFEPMNHIKDGLFETLSRTLTVM